MINTSTRIAAGLALSLGVACGEPRTERPVVGPADQGQTASQPGIDALFVAGAPPAGHDSASAKRHETTTDGAASLSLVATLSLVDRP